MAKCVIHYLDSYTRGVTLIRIEESKEEEVNPSKVIAAVVAQSVYRLGYGLDDRVSISDMGREGTFSRCPCF
jgi:hypothetical protein